MQSHVHVGPSVSSEVASIGVGWVMLCDAAEKLWPRLRQTGSADMALLQSLIDHGVLHEHLLPRLHSPQELRGLEESAGASGWLWPLLQPRAAGTLPCRHGLGPSSVLPGNTAADSLAHRRSTASPSLCQGVPGTRQRVQGRTGRPSRLVLRESELPGVVAR